MREKRIDMPRSSRVHYIAPSAISITPNANSSANDLAVYVARGAKIKVFSNGISQLGYVNNTFQEWTLRGRNRRLTDDKKPYTIYARLPKNDKTNGYLVFAPKVYRTEGWQDKYCYVTETGLTSLYQSGKGGASVKDNLNWWIKLGEVSLPENNQRTVTLDTGILGTDQYNNEWNLDPDLLPLRIELDCSIDGEDAGNRPYVAWGKELIMRARLVEGWTDTDVARFDHWEIRRNTGDDAADARWNALDRSTGYRQSGNIALSHARGVGDDFNGAVSTTFTIIAMGTADDDSSSSSSSSSTSDSSSSSSSSSSSDNLVPIAAATLNVMAETVEQYALELSTGVCSYDPTTDVYSPIDGIKVRIRATDQKGNVFKMTRGQMDAASLAVQYALADSDAWATMEFTGAAAALAESTIDIRVFYAQQNVNVRIVKVVPNSDSDSSSSNSSESSQTLVELYRTPIAFVRNGEDSREREWIYLRSEGPLTFGEDPEGHLLPALIEGGEVEPQAAATGLDTNKQQDGWVPEGWWDEEQGTDADHRYEYASHRDWIRDEGASSDSSSSDSGERSGGHWGEFSQPVIWHYLAEDAVTYRCRWTLNGVEVFQLKAAYSGAFRGTLPLVATLMKRVGNNPEQQVTATSSIVTVNFDGLSAESQPSPYNVTNPQFTIGSGEGQHPEFVPFLSNAALSAINITFNVGGEPHAFSIPVIREADEESVKDTIDQYGSTLFLSKAEDDEAHGLIGFVKGFWVKTKGLFGFDGDGNIKANDINADGSATVGGDAIIDGDTSVRGKFEAYGQATINDIKSRSYSGTGLADTGWAITNDNGSGSSQAIFDYLTIRKKMIVNALESKETHFSAGDVAHTLAAAEIARTDYLYVDGSGRETLLGYSQVKVPWLLRGAALLLGKESFASRRLLTHYKKVRMTLTNDDLSVCNRVRCYFLAKDGDREIENWFRVCDLVRCQTWNIVKTRRETFIPDLEDHAGNVYWWRKITDVSWNTGVQRYVAKDASGRPTENTTTDINSAYVNEGGIPRIANNGTYGSPDIKHSPKTIDGNTYHWFDVAFGYNAERSGEANWCDMGSDLPAAGDKVVQFGNTTDPDRMNIFMIEVNGAGNPDAPDWKMYRGVYAFDLKNCWWGGETCCKTKWSVATGIEAYAPQFKWVTEYGVARQVFVRDEIYWSSLPLERDDFTNERAISSYPDYSDDIVDSNGNFVSRGGYKIVNGQKVYGSAQNPIPKNWVRKCRYYEQVSHNGSTWLCSIAESWYWRDENGNRVAERADNTEYVRSYTCDEPTPASNDWTEQVEKGDPGAFKSTAFCLTNTDISSYKPQGGTSGSPWPTSTKNASGATVSGITWTDEIPSGTAKIWMTTAWFYSDGTHSEWTSPRNQRDTETLDVEFSPSPTQPDNPVGTAANKDTSSIKTQRHNQGGTNMGWFDPNDTLTGWTWSDMKWRAERKIKNGEYYGSWAISRIKGENAIRIDLSNDNDTMLYSSSKGLVSGSVTSVATLWDGSKDVSSQATWEKTANMGCEATFDATTRTITLTGMTALVGYVEIKATYTDKNKTTYTPTIRMRLKKLVDADKYDLEITPNSIAYNVTKDNPAESTLTIRVFKTSINSDGSVTREQTISLPTGYSVYAGSTKLTGNSSSKTYTHTTDNSAISEVQVKIATSADATDFLDCETIPVVKAEDGANGDTPMQAFQWNNSAKSAPSPLPSGATLGNWSTNAPNRPSTAGDHYLWMTQTVKHIAKNGTVTYDNWSAAVRISGNKGDAGEDASDREFIYIRTNTYPFDGTQPKNVSRGKVHGTGDWVPKANQYTVDDYVPEGWSDTAIAIEEDNRYVYAAIRTKAAGHNQQWSDFIDAFLWSNWGHQGIDGDGVQYIYKLFDHELTDAERTSNIPTKPAEMTDGEWIPSGWSDDPLAPTAALPFCYCSVIKKIGGSWADHFEKLGLWSKWTKDGKNSIRLALDNEHEDFLYKDGGTAPIAPVGGATSEIHLYDGQTDKRSELTASTLVIDYSKSSGIPAASETGHPTINYSTFVLSVPHITAATAEVVVKATYKDAEYYAKFTANKTTGDKYDLVLKPNAIAFNSSEAWTNKTIGITYNQMDAQGNKNNGLTPAIAVANGNVCVYYSYVKSDGSLLTPSLNFLNASSFTLTETNAKTYIGIYFELRKLTSNDGSTYRMCDYETVEIAKTQNGANGSALVVDLTNRNVSIPLDEDGHLQDSLSLTTTVQAFFDTAEVPNVVITDEDGNAFNNKVIGPYTISTTGKTVNIAVKKWTESDMTVLYAVTTIDIMATCRDASNNLLGSRIVTLSLTAFKSGGVGDNAMFCDLMPQPGALKFARTADGGYDPSSRTLTVYLKNVDGKTTDLVLLSETAYTCRYSYTDFPATTSDGTVVPTTGTNANKITGITPANGNTLYLSLFSGTTRIDFEDVPIVSDGENGQPGKNSIRLALDNEHEDFLYKDGGTAPIAPVGGATSEIHLYDGQTDKRSELTASTLVIDYSKSSGIPAASETGHPTINYSTFVLSVPHITAATAEVVVKATYKDAEYYAKFTANKTTGDKYDLVLKPNAIAFNSSEAWTNKTIGITYNQMDAQGNKNNGLTPAIAVANGNVCVYYSYVKSDGSLLTPSLNFLNASSFTLTETNAKTYIGIYFELRKLTSNDGSTYRMCDYETVEIAKTENGEPFTWDDLTDEQKEELTGADGVAVTLEPGNVLITQSDTQVGGSYPLLTVDTLLVREVQVDVLAKSVVMVNDGGEPKNNFTIGTPVPSKISGTTDNSCTVVRGDDGKTIGITAIGTHTVDGKTVYVDHGYVDIPVTYKDTLYTLRLNFYCNLLGDWKDGVIGDTKTEIGKSTWFDVDANGNIVESQRLGTFIRSSKENISRLEESNYFNIFTGVNPSFPFTFALTADDLAKFGTSYRFSLQVESVTENLTIQIRHSLAIIKTYTNVNDVLDDILTLSQAGTYTITCSATATIIGIGIYAENTDKYSEISQTVNEIGLVVNDPNTGVAALNIKADSITSTVSQLQKGKNMLSSPLIGTGWMSASSSITPHSLTKDVSDNWIEHNDGDSYVVSPSLSIKKDAEYMLSFDVSSQVTGAIAVKIYSTSFQLLHELTTNTSGRRKVKFTATANNSVMVYFQTQKVHFPQLELGSTATDFEANTSQITSQITQTADNIQLFVTDGLNKTGIDITNGNIDIVAGKVTFSYYDNGTKKSDKISINAATGTLKAVDVDLTGKITATSGSITGQMNIASGGSIIVGKEDSYRIKIAQSSNRGYITMLDGDSNNIILINYDTGKNAGQIKVSEADAQHERYTFINPYSMESIYNYKNASSQWNGDYSHITTQVGRRMAETEYHDLYVSGGSGTIRHIKIGLGTTGSGSSEQSVVNLRAYNDNKQSAWPVCRLNPNGANWMDKGHVHVMTMAELKVLLDNPDYAYSNHLANYAVMLTRINDT